MTLECLIQNCKNEVKGLVWNTLPNNNIIKLNPPKGIIVVTIPGTGPYPVCKKHMHLVQDLETTSVYGFSN